MSTTETSMREDLEAAIEPFEVDDDTIVATVEKPEVEAAAEETITAADFEEKPSGDEESETAEAKAAPETPESEVSGQDEPAAAAEPEPVAAEPAEPAADIEKAPTSWTPSAREGWKDLPEPVRQQVAKRELEITQALENGKEHRKTGENFKAVVDRYAQVMAAEGVTDPIHGVEELMKSVSVMRMGTPAQKAEKIAQFIKGYEVPIDVLDGILAGEGPSPAIGDATTQMIDQRLAPVNQLLEKISNAEKQRNFDNNQKLISDVQTFSAANEFYDDVKGDMADLVDMAANRGVQMTLEDAYKKACAMNPDVSSVQAKRAADAALMGNANTIAAKRDAASSITGDKGGVAAKGEMSMKQQIEDAWNQQTG